MLKFLHKKLALNYAFRLTSGAILFCGTINAQNDSNMVLGQPWSLNQCINYAWKHNLSIKQAEVNRDIAQNNVTSSKANILPSFNGLISNTWNYGRTIDPFTNTFANSQVLSQDFYVSTAFTIWGGEQNVNTVKQNQASYNASRYDVEVSKNNIALNIASGYLQVLLDQELLNEAKSQHEVTLQQVEHTQQMVDAGSLSRSNLLDVQAQEANDEVNEVNAQTQLDLATLGLAQLLDIDSVQLFKIVTPEINIPDNPGIDGPEQVYSKALTTMPDVQSAQLKWQSSEDAKQAAAGALYPKLTFNASAGSGYSGSDDQTSVVNESETIGYISGTPIVVQVPTEEVGALIPWSQQFNDNFNKSIGFRLNIPILNGLQSNMAYRNAKLNALNNYYNFETSQIILRKNIQQAYADALGALKKYHATKKSVASFQEAYNYAKTRFDVGMATALDLNTAETNLAKAKSDNLQAKYNYVFKIKVLDYYEGKPLKL
ncbi:MAG: TolC family protein [Bacteroidia bacterium]